MKAPLESKSPIEITYMNISLTPLTWEINPLIVYILAGTLSVKVNENSYHLVEDDLLLINPFDLYTFSASNCKVALFMLNLATFEKFNASGQYYYFDCNAATIDSKRKLIPIKRYLAMLVKDSQTRKNNSQLMTFSLGYELLHHLVTNFQVQSQIPALPNRQRLAEILTYVNSHYREPLTLKSLAKHFYLTSPYLSKIIKDALGKNFKDYINELRLASAVGDLSNFNYTIDYIADTNGFANARSFAHIFKKKYTILPSDYRNQIQKDQSLVNTRTANRNEVGIIHQSHLGRLAEYLNTLKTSEVEVSEPVQYSELPSVATKQKGFQLNHTFKRVTTIGMARHLLLADFQDMLKNLQEDIGFQYIKFHGLLNDDMMVYSEDASGTPMLSFTYIDKAFDFLLSIGLKPMVQLSYMPKDLASDTKKTIHYLESVISLPKDYNKWTHLISQLVIHLQNRYGSDEVREWPFYLWNTPDGPEALSGIKNKEDFFHFYKVTYKAIKSIDPNIEFGGPPLMNYTLEDGQWVTDYLTYAKNNNCSPAFMNYHFYPVIVNSTLTSETLSSSNLVLDPSEDALKNSINQIKRNNRDMGWQMNRYYITEWNSSISHRELLNDTAFKPAYIVKNVLENYDRLESFAFWSLSDFIEEIQISERLFHGGVGLFTYNGIKKAQYYAFVLLARLGNHLLSKGDGYFVTKNGTSYQIILYNYQHYSSLYASGELFDMTFKSRYTPFPDLHKHKYIVPLSELESSHYIITDTILNRKNGSAFDKWIELGAMSLETKEEVHYLKSVSVPKITKERQILDKGVLIISRTLEPHEVRLIEIKPEIF